MGMHDLVIDFDLNFQWAPLNGITDNVINKII
jgi:hypothetical protein